MLKEDGAMQTFRDLESTQVAMLIKLAKREPRELNFDQLSPKDWATLDALRDRNLVDDSFRLTAAGQRGAALGMKYGSADLQRASSAGKKLGRDPFGPPTTYTGGNGDEVDTDDIVPEISGQDQWGSVRDRDD